MSFITPQLQRALKTTVPLAQDPNTHQIIMPVLYLIQTNITSRQFMTNGKTNKTSLIVASSLRILCSHDQVGSKIEQKYNKPKTPFQRIMESDVYSEDQK